MEIEYQVYVVQNPQGRFYIGISENVSVRVAQHNEGVSKWTKGKGPWTLVWTSEAKSLSDARKLENLLKKQKGGAGFFRLTGLSRSSGSQSRDCGIAGSNPTPATTLKPRNQLLPRLLFSGGHQVFLIQNRSYFSVEVDGFSEQACTTRGLLSARIEKSGCACLCCRS
ncbi:GIY-YIG nuclease family protein [Verrucomicrobiota bacterium sgz303538]